MRILIVATCLSKLGNLLDFSAQLVNRIDQAPTVLLVAAQSREIPGLERLVGEIKALDGYKNAIVEVRRGPIAEAVRREMAAHRHHLVVLDEQPSTTSLARRWRKSVAAQIVEHTRCPVLLVRGENRVIQRILLCDSGGENSPLLSRLTAQFADLLAGEESITVLHVMSQISAGPGVVGKQLRAEAPELIAAHTPEGVLLEQDLRVLAKSQVYTHPKVRHGLVLDEILTEVHSGDYDLIVIGAHKSIGWQRFLLDNLAQKIIAKINLPILVVKDTCAD